MKERRFVAVLPALAIVAAFAAYGCEGSGHRLVLQVPEDPLYNPFADSLVDEMDLHLLRVVVCDPDCTTYVEFEYEPTVGEFAGGWTRDLGRLPSGPDRPVFAEGFNASGTLVAYGESQIQQLRPGWTTSIDFRRLLAYVAYSTLTPEDRGVMVVDAVSGTILSKIPTLFTPTALAASASGGTIYVVQNPVVGGAEIIRFSTRSHVLEEDWYISLWTDECSGPASMSLGQGSSYWLACAESDTLVSFRNDGSYDVYSGPDGTPQSRVFVSAGRRNNPWLLRGSAATLHYFDAYNGEYRAAPGTWVGGGLAAEPYGNWVYASSDEGLVRIGANNENDILTLPLPTPQPISAIAFHWDAEFPVIVAQDVGTTTRLLGYASGLPVDAAVTLADQLNFPINHVVVAPGGERALALTKDTPGGFDLEVVDLTSATATAVPVDLDVLGWAAMPVEITFYAAVIGNGSGE